MSKQTIFVALIALIAMGTVSENSVQEACGQDGPFSRLIPRGRLIQRARDDLNNGKPFIPNPFARSTEPTKAPTPKQPTAKKPVAKTPTLRSPVAKTPTKAVKKPVPDVRTKELSTSVKLADSGTEGQFDRPPINLRSKSPLGPPRRAGEASLNLAETADVTNNSNVNIAMPAGFEEPDPMKMKATVGFGMIIEKVGADNFVVTRVKPAGNAENAGVKRGDRILSVGGVEVDSLRLYDEITREMEGGDQLEFVLTRNIKGEPKEEKMLVQFGEMPDYETGPAPALNAPATTNEPSLNQTLEVTPPVLAPQPGIATPTSRRSTNTPDFAPPRSTSGLRSILDGPVQGGEIDLPALNGPNR